MRAPFDAARPVREGSKLALVAPSGPFDLALFERGVERLRSRYEVVFDDGIRARQGYLAGDDARRLAELQAALADPSVDAIVCARGGYGATRLLPGIDVEAVRTANKLLVGFSDVTALHALWARAGVRSLHATMVASLGKGDDAAFVRWAADLERGPTVPTQLVPVVPGVADGVLLGGNLSVLVSLIGTPYAPSLDGAVLFLEDVGERPYRVDRMLTQLRHAGALEGVRAVLLGQFSACGPGPDGTKVEDVLRERLGDLGVPVYAGAESGHGETNHALAFGTRVAVGA